jgi:hypothetical protein
VCRFGPCKGPPPAAAALQLLGDELLLPAAAGVARDMGGARSGDDL